MMASIMRFLIRIWFEIILVILLEMKELEYCIRLAELIFLSMIIPERSKRVTSSERFSLMFLKLMGSGTWRIPIQPTELGSMERGRQSTSPLIGKSLRILVRHNKSYYFSEGRSIVKRKTKKCSRFFSSQKHEIIPTDTA